MDREWMRQEANALLSKTGNGSAAGSIHTCLTLDQLCSQMTRSRCKGGALSWRQTMFNLSGVSTISINPGTGETKG
ncbi:uncharacterized protein PpBr36_09373 [Pyricularia pennisetigena]|uniref:uncharacterized protein n=1 Tax=Pyricularia pennisetigena TaxID=1578925 RepID=UPI001153F601|nr:uncharacterized protein PpBr36_09373 [Pyricularia pennisetigena]TLS21995.1 hypothetical protein PpBr36_09373 [Pyricularia pennisetigena]